MMDEIKYYKNILKRNPTHKWAFDACVEELNRVPLFADENKALMEHYACTWAPVLVEFTTWVLDDARGRNIKKLYFLSRDAYPMYLIAKTLSEDEGSQINNYPEIYYLRVSRYALRVPEMMINKDEYLESVFLSGIDVTMCKILKRAALTEVEMEEVAKIIGFDKPLNVILSRPEILKWKKCAIEHQEEIWPYVKKHAEECMPQLMGYLRNEGLLCGDKMAIVDSGWIGTTQKSLLNILKYHKPDVDIEGYYFGLYEIPQNMDSSKYHTFYFAPHGDIRAKVNFSNCLFEAVSSEAAGMTLGYEKWENSTDDTKYEPVLADGGNLNEEFLKDSNFVLDIYAKTYSKNLQYDNNKRVSRFILRKLMSSPSKWEAKEYGRLLFCDDVLEDGAQAIAADLSYEDICNLRLFRKMRIWIDARRGRCVPTIHESGWIYGTIVNCDKNVGYGLWQARLYNTLMYIRKGIRII